MTNENKKRIFGIEIVHSIEGRIRIAADGIKYLENKKNDIENEIKKISFVKECTANTITGRMLIVYNENEAEVKDIIEITENIITGYSLEIYSSKAKQNGCGIVKERRLQEEEPSDILKRITFAMAGIALKPMLNYGTGIINPISLLTVFLSKSIFRSGISSIISYKKPNADTLTAAAILTAIVTNKERTALATVILSDIAELMTSYTMKKTRTAIKDMLSIEEKEVWVKEDGRYLKKNINDLKKGDLLFIQSGDKICADGFIREGEAYVDESAITGEYMPSYKKNEDRLFAGTLVKNGNIIVEAEKVGDETALSRIVHLVEDAPNNKADIQIYADRFSTQLIPLNFGLAALVYIFTRDITRTLNMLVIDYSCGVRLSTATALSAAIYNAARNKVLIKGGNFIESLAESETIIFDKTGTMTEGKPRLVSIISTSSYSEDKILQFAAAAEETSTHPLAHAIVTGAKKKGLLIPEHEDIITHVSKGVETISEGMRIFAGSKKFMLENGVNTDAAKSEAEKLLMRGENIIFIAINGEISGIIGVYDTLRENMKKTINRLRIHGFDEIKLLTGDLENNAEILAGKMALDDFEFEMLPEDKAKSILRTQMKGSKVIMVGDGINDAPALAHADVGIAIGSKRTDIAIEAADITIIDDDPMFIPATVILARKTMGIVRGNFAVTVGVNSAGLLLGALGILPVFWASVLHNMTTIIVVMNSGRLLMYKFDKGRL